MTRQMRRASEANGRRQQRREWTPLVDVTDETRERNQLFGSPGFNPDGVWQNTRYIVFVWDGKKIPELDLLGTKLMIRRSDSEPIYSWPDLQRIKNELYGPEATAIQFFPPESELIDDANLYWLWVL